MNTYQRDLPEQKRHKLVSFYGRVAVLRTLTGAVGADPASCARACARVRVGLRTILTLSRTL